MTDGGTTSDPAEFTPWLPHAGEGDVSVDDVPRFDWLVDGTSGLTDFLFAAL